MTDMNEDISGPLDRTAEHNDRIADITEVILDTDIDIAADDAWDLAVSIDMKFGEHLISLQSARQSDLAKIEALTKVAQGLIDALFLCKDAKIGFGPAMKCANAIKNAAIAGITPTPEP